MMITSSILAHRDATIDEIHISLPRYEGEASREAVEDQVSELAFAVAPEATIIIEWRSTDDGEIIVAADGDRQHPVTDVIRAEMIHAYWAAEAQAHEALPAEG